MKKMFAALLILTCLAALPAAAADERQTGTLVITAGHLTRTLTFGVDPAATALRDPNLDEREVPPPPPAGVFDARFLVGGEGTTRDLRPPDGSAVHRVRVQAPAGRPSILVTVMLPEGASATLRDVHGGMIFREPLRNGRAVVVTPQVAEILELAVTYDGRQSGSRDNPSTFTVQGAYPNPFNPATRISYALPEARMVRLEVFTITGQRLATLVSGMQEAGNHTTEWDASGTAGGVYLFRLTAGADVRVGRLILLK